MNLDTGGAWSQAFEYNSPGSVTSKTQVGAGQILTANYTYNNEGQLVSTQYPNSGPTFTYTLDSMGRPIKLTDNQAAPVDWAKDVVYNVAGQMTQVQVDYPNFLNKTYTYSATQNDGRITQMTANSFCYPLGLIVPLGKTHHLRSRLG
jgi:hypothetical protein